MTKRFLEEPFERNPVLQFAAVNYLMTEEVGKHTRVLSSWSKKLESVGMWYDQLLAESLGKQGRGPTPFTAVMIGDAPGMDGKMTKHKIVTEMPDDNTMKFAMYAGDSKEPAFTILYKRKK